MTETKGWTNIRWIGTGVYLGVAIVISILMILMEDKGEILGIILSTWVIGALIPFFILLAYPSMKLRKEMKGREILLDEDLLKVKKPKVDNISDSIPFIWVFVIIGATILIVQGAISIYPIIEGEAIMVEVLIGNVATVAFIALIAILFHRLDIEVDKKLVHFHWGLFGKKLKINEITEIRPVAVHPLRDFMGYGIRTGSDGSLGYISNSKFGVKITTTEGRTYTVSTNKPMEICELVRWYIK